MKNNKVYDEAGGEVEITWIHNLIYYGFMFFMIGSGIIAIVIAIK